MPDRKLGKLPPRHDPRTLQLARYLRPQLPPPPTQVNWSGAVQRFGMLLNDQLGDCTCAGVGHAIQTWTANAGSEANITDQQVLTAYEAVSGYNPQTGANDNGAVELDVLNYWRQTGVAGHKIRAFTKVDHTNLCEIEQAINLFGLVYVGTVVPAGWEQAPAVWDVRPDDQIVGGHCIIYVGYDQEFFYLVSWGQVFRITRAAHAAYVDETWAVVSDDWIEQDGKAPSGFDTAQLLTDLAELS